MAGLYIWIEGDDDERFLSKVLDTVFEERYDWIKPIQYAQRNKAYVDNYIKSIESMGADYIFFSDNDTSQCLVSKRDGIRSSYRYCTLSNIQIVVEEIESWYFAGVPEQKFTEWGLSDYGTTGTLTKEQFNALIPTRFSRTDFMVEILKYFSIEVARRRNQSFDRFVDKFS